MQLQVPFWWVIGISRSKGGGSIDDEVGRGDEAEEVSIMDASLDVSNLLDGCAIVGTRTLQE